MEETKRIADQLQRAFEGEAWHGPSLRELLAEVSAEKAASRPLALAHNIWEIVLHVAAWHGGVKRRLDGLFHASRRDSTRSLSCRPNCVVEKGLISEFLPGRVIHNHFLIFFFAGAQHDESLLNVLQINFFIDGLNAPLIDISSTTCNQAPSLAL